MRFVGSVFWRGVPAPGYRHRDTGAQNGIGNYGFSWSSTSYDSGDHYRGMDLDFNATGLNPNYAAYRAYGNQLRCLSE